MIIKRSESASLLVSERVQIAPRAFRQRRNIARSAAVQTVGEQGVCHTVAMRRIPCTALHAVIPCQSFGLDRKKQAFRLAFSWLPCGSYIRNRENTRNFKLGKGYHLQRSDFLYPSGKVLTILHNCINSHILRQYATVFDFCISWHQCLKSFRRSRLW